jgi:exopolyphosphatase/guanosine-5'-triphosphate,3'-diphosphate pyrophosphatase
MSMAKRRRGSDGTFSGNTPGRAIIDIGSNTVRMVIYGGTMRAPTVLLNEKVTAKLGRDIASKGVLADEAIDLAMRGLKRFALLLSDLKVHDVETVATAAVREASNGSKFIAGLKKLGFKPKIITGEEEASLSANGVIGAFPEARGIVADLGGGSLELVRLTEDGQRNAVSLPLGTLRLPDFRGETRGAMRKALEKALKKGAPKFPKDEPLYLVGGTLRTMAVYAMQEQSHPLSDPHGFELDPREAKRSLGKALANETVETLKARDRISSMRADKLPDASVLAEAMLARFEPSRIIFSPGVCARDCCIRHCPSTAKHAILSWRESQCLPLNAALLLLWPRALPDGP